MFSYVFGYNLSLLPSKGIWLKQKKKTFVSTIYSVWTFIVIKLKRKTVEPRSSYARKSRKIKNKSIIINVTANGQFDYYFIANTALRFRLIEIRLLHNIISRSRISTRFSYREPGPKCACPQRLIRMRNEFQRIQ